MSAPRDLQGATPHISFFQPYIFKLLITDLDYLGLFTNLRISLTGGCRMLVSAFHCCPIDNTCNFYVESRMVRGVPQ